MDDPPFPRAASGRVENPGEIKATVHVYTTVYHGSVYVQSSVVVMGRGIAWILPWEVPVFLCKQIFRFDFTSSRLGGFYRLLKRRLAAVGMRGFVWM